MSTVLNFLLQLISQFVGGPGPIENNLVRYGLTTILFGVLLSIAWFRRRHHDLPREKWLVWGFGLGLVHGLFMFGHIALQMLTGMEHQAGHFTSEPLEHVFAMAALVVIAGAFLRYILDDTLLPRRYLQVGLGLTAICYLATFWWWPRYIVDHPEIKFHQTWGAWLFHIAISGLIMVAIAFLARKRGWLRNVVLLALTLFLMSEFRILVNFATDKAYRQILCPIGNSFHMLAILLLGFVYIRELFAERHQAETELKTYRDHLEDLVEQRTMALTKANEQLQQEIIERKRVERALRQSEERFRQVISSISDHIYMTEITEAGERINRYISPNVETLTGYAHEQFLADWQFWPSTVIHVEDRALATAHALHLALEHRDEIEYRLVRADGQTIWVRDSARIEEEGTSKIVYGVVGDITARKQAEHALEQLSRQNELILNSAGEGIFGVDVAGNHTFVNRAGARMLGYDPQELIGQPSHPTWHHSKADGSPFPVSECPLHTGYKTGQVRRGDDQLFWRKDGSGFPVQYVSTPIYECGRLMGAVIVFRDITEQKRIQAEINQRSSELAAQNAIAATISQSLDLSTILNTALNTAMAVLEMDVGALFLLDSDDQTLTLKIHRGGGPVLYRRMASARPLRLGECIAGRAVMDMQPVLVDASREETGDLPPFIAQERLQTMVSTPLLAKDKALGALTLGSRREGAIPAKSLELLTAIGQQIGMAIDNADLHRETERWAEELALLHQVSIFLNSTLDPVKICDRITEQSLKLVNCQAALFFRWEAETQEAVGVTGYGLPDLSVNSIRLTLPEHSILEELITHRRSIAVEDAQTDPRVRSAWREAFNIQALVWVPVWGPTKPLGFLLIIDQRQPRSWRSDEVALLESFVNRAAVALENAYLHRQVKRAATLEERQRIAAEMHDGLAQTLSYLGHKVDHALELTQAGQLEPLMAELNPIRQTIDRATQEVRRSIASLQSAPQPRQSLQDWLSEVMAEFAGDNGPAFSFKTTLTTPLFLPPEQLEQVRRVIREGLLNACRHAQAERINIYLEKQADKATVTVEDDGRGFDPDALPTDEIDHFGIKIMRARAARIQGQIEIDSAPGRGTQVRLTWPWKNTASLQSGTAQATVGERTSVLETK